MGAEATQISAFAGAAAHALCFAGLAAAHALAGRGALVSDPALALCLLVVCEAPLVIVVFSLLQRDPNRCSFLKAAARGLFGFLVGALLNAFGAVVLGAPVGIKFLTATVYWSLLMSLFTMPVPTARCARHAGGQTALGPEVDSRSCRLLGDEPSHLTCGLTDVSPVHECAPLPLL